MVRGLNASQWHEADNHTALAQQLSDAVAANLVESIQNQSRASLVVSGGSTPLPFFHALAKAELDWSKVDVTLADERWVPADHQDSNETFVKDNLLTGAAASARFISLYRADKSPQQALQEMETSLAEMIRPYTVVILGMGGDGHTASLFPGVDGLEEALDLDARAELAVIAPATVPQVRISMTRAALLRSRYRYLHITGSNKREVLEGALNQNDSPALPISSFFEKHLPPVSVYWSP